MATRIITIPFTEDFIAGLVKLIDRHYIKQGKDLTRLHIVFGGHRPALFLKKILSKKFKTAFYPPKVMTIDELITTIAPQRRMLADLDHCFLVYELAKTHAPVILKGREGFVQFLPWAREIIYFIEQLDLENTPYDALLSLKAKAAIGFDVPEDINSLLKSLFVLRRVYHAYLDEHGLTSRGYRYLQASRNIGQKSFDEADEILFCNFFYLHRSESAVIKDLYVRDKASLLMQGDQRRWPALKRIAKEFGQDIKEGSSVLEPQFTLELYAAFDTHAQAGLVSQILRDIKDQENTVIVLPQPDAMLPLLSTIATQVGEFNVSLGYPLRRSALYMLFDLIVSAQQTLKKDGYYSRDYLKVLRHPLVKGLSLGAIDGVTALYIHHLEQCLTGATTSAISGLLFIRIDDILCDECFFDQLKSAFLAQGLDISNAVIKDLAIAIHNKMFVQWESIIGFTQLSRVMEDFSVFMYTNTTLSQYLLNEHVTRRLMDIAKEWAEVEFDTGPFVTLDLLKIMQERLGREVVAFKGSPLKGLQVLGLIETRSLSFENVIVLDVNEGTLPNLNIYEPLIPREVMIGLNIDRLELEEEIQRYQFMRLISSAKNVHLIYLERPDKQRSRFVEELIWRKEQAIGRTDVVPILRPAFTVTLSQRQRQASKSPAMVEMLKGFVFSASSINTYKRNPYMFYQNYVLGLKPKEDLLEDPESKHVGTFVHGILEDAFRLFIGQTPVMDERFRKLVKSMFDERFDAHFGRGQRSDAFLLRVVLENRLDRFLEIERARVEESVDRIMHIERKFVDTIDLPCGNIKLSLRMDRVEKLKNGTILVIDYKTGNVDEGSVQMPLYLNYLHKQFPKDQVNAAYYMLKTQELNMYISKKELRPLDDILGEFFVELDRVIGEIFNQEIPFIDKEDGIK